MIANGYHTYKCPDCLAELLVADGDRIEHVGPVSQEWPYGWHRFVPAEAPAPTPPRSRGDCA